MRGWGEKGMVKRVGDGEWESIGNGDRWVMMESGE